MASSLDPSQKLPFIQWGEKQIAEDASTAPITVNLSAEMDGVAFGGLISRISAEHNKATIQAGLTKESERIEATNTAAPHTIQQAKHIVELAQELRFMVEAQAMDSHTIEQIEIRKKRVADLRNELTSLGVAIPSDPSAAPAI